MEGKNLSLSKNRPLTRFERASKEHQSVTLESSRNLGFALYSEMSSAFYVDGEKNSAQTHNLPATL